MTRRHKIARLRHKYGANIVNDFLVTIFNDGVSLTSLAKKYKFSKEYARKLFIELNHGSYREKIKLQKQL